MRSKELGMGRLDGQVAFITGAARGQGRSHAIRLAEEGADIIAIDLCEDVPDVPYPGATEADLAETMRLVEALDRRIVAERADVRDINSLQRVVDRGVAEFGRLDIVVANAGIGLKATKAELLSEEVWSDMVDINLNGVWRTAKVAIPHIRAGGRGGSIVLVSSALGLMSYENTAHYTSAKHGVVGLTRALALELAHDMIRVNSIHPTQVETTMIMNETSMKLFCPHLENPTLADFAEASQATNALPIPWVQPRDISNAVLFLSCDEGRYITGVALPVDAGQVIKH
jgi:SDR family mycofactocin-dependent oxidoreductase